MRITSKKTITILAIMATISSSAFAIGSNTGYNNVSNGDYGTVFGSNNTTQTSATSSLAFGDGNVVKQANSMAFGQGNVSDGENSFVGGDKAKAIGRDSFAFGSSAHALTEYTVAIGSQARTNGKNTVAIGNGAYASNMNALSFGASTEAAGIASTAIGYGNKAKSDYAVAMGYQNTVKGDQASAFGTNNESTGANSIVVGNHSTTTADETFVAGFKSKATEYSAVAVGNQATATGRHSLAIGTLAEATVINTIAIGHNAYAANENSVAIGNNSKTESTVGTSSVSIGSTTYNFAGGTPVGTVSIGDVNKERTLTNLAAGRINSMSTDAINGSQLHAVITEMESKNQNTLSQANHYTDTQINKGVAKASALAGLKFLDYNPKDKWSFAASIGHYRNANAVAVGAAYQPNENTMVHGGITVNGKVAYNLGVSFKTGGQKYINKYELAEQVRQLQSDNAELRQELNELRSMIEKK